MERRQKYNCIIGCRFTSTSLKNIGAHYESCGILANAKKMNIEVLNSRLDRILCKYCTAVFNNKKMTDTTKLNIISKISESYNTEVLGKLYSLFITHLEKRIDKSVSLELGI